MSGQRPLDLDQHLDLDLTVDLDLVQHMCLDKHQRLDPGHRPGQASRLGSGSASVPGPRALEPDSRSSTSIWTWTSWHFLLLTSGEYMMFLSTTSASMAISVRR